MISTELSGVIACHSIITTRPEVTPRKSVPFKAWPEISDWLTYYTLPTIGVIYRPATLPHTIGASLGSWPLEDILEKLSRYAQVA
jgi:hypothetical protein